MGDLYVVISKWPEILAGLLEKQYTHAKFNIISSGVKPILNQVFYWFLLSFITLAGIPAATE